MLILDFTNLLCPRFVMTKLSSDYYVHFWERYEIAYHPSHRLNGISADLLQGWFLVIAREIWYAIEQRNLANMFRNSVNYFHVMILTPFHTFI